MDAEYGAPYLVSQSKGGRTRRTGRRTRTSIGPLKKGKLKAVGYDATAAAPARHTALDKAVKKYGRLSTLRKLNAIAVYTKRTAPSRSRTYKTDRNYVKKSYF
jgi:hypothetical protein